MKQEKYGFVYIWYDRKHKRYYIGCHWGSEDDGYICSSPWMKSSYKRRPQDFTRKILSSGHDTKKEMLKTESDWLSLITEDELGKRYYNLTNKYQNHWAAGENCKTIGEKISKSNKGREVWSKGAVFSEEHRKKLSLAKKGTVGPNLGKKFSEEHRKKLSLAKKKKNLSGVNSHSFGKPRSEEVKLKISKTHRSLAKKGCIYCGLLCSPSMLTRHHDDNCKHKPK